MKKVMKVAAMFAAMVLTAAGFAADFPSYLEINGTTVTGYTDGLPANLVIPEGVTAIGKSAFSGCKSLTSVTIPDGVTAIGRSAFSGCKSLESVTVSRGVTYISYEAFRGCTSLADVTLADGVRIIGESAFFGCKSLTSVTIPDSVRIIVAGAFKGCKNIAVTYKGSLKDWNPRSGQPLYLGSLKDWCATDWDSSRYVLKGIRLSDGTDPKKLTNVSANDLTGVTKIGNRAFLGCKSLANVTIPNSVTAIGDDAFSGCKSLMSVTIPESVTRIGNGTFAGCKNLTVQYGGTKAQWNAIKKERNIGRFVVQCSDGTL